MRRPCAILMRGRFVEGRTRRGAADSVRRAFEQRLGAAEMDRAHAPARVVAEGAHTGPSRPQRAGDVREAGPDAVTLEAITVRALGRFEDHRNAGLARS